MGVKFNPEYMLVTNLLTTISIKKIEEIKKDILNRRCSQIYLKKKLKDSLNKKNLENNLGEDLINVNSVEYPDGTIFFRDGKIFYTYSINEEMIYLEE